MDLRESLQAKVQDKRRLVALPAKLLRDQQPGTPPGEVFGPILHMIRYRADHLGRVVDTINSMGYGLTLGIHSRVEETANRVRARARVGNTYIN